MADIKRVKLPDGSVHNLRDSNLNGHTVNADVPSDAKFTDTNNVKIITPISISLNESTTYTDMVLSESDCNYLLNNPNTFTLVVAWNESKSAYVFYVPMYYGGIGGMPRLLGLEHTNGGYKIISWEFQGDTTYSSSYESTSTDLNTTEYIDTSFSRNIDTFTLKATSWASDGTYDLENTHDDKQWPSENFDIEQLQPYGTKDQCQAFASAGIIGSNTSNKLKALGTVPTIDIPVMFYARRI